MLTPKQETFALAYVETGNASEAYRKAYPKARHWKPETVHKRASELLTNGAILGRVKALQAELAERNLWRREQSVKALIRVIEAPDKQADVVAAVKVLNAMHGYNAPEKVEIGPGVPGKIIIDWGEEKEEMLREIERRADAGLG